MRRLLLLLPLLLLPTHALGLPSYCTITGTVLDAAGNACGGCKVSFTTAGNQEVGGATFPGGKVSSWTTESDGDLPAGVQIARTLIVKIQIDKGATVTVQIPDSSTANISSLLLEPVTLPSSTNINSLAGDLAPTKLDATNSPTDEYCYTYEATGDTGEWQTCSSGSGDITDVGDCSTGACFSGTRGNALQFEGSTADTSETTLTAADPTADRTLTLPDVTGTLGIERVYDVRVYGAKCDDSTNDAAAIQAAIDAAEATTQGGVVELPVGICKVSSGLTMNEPGVILRGQGAAVSNNGTVLSCDMTTGTCVTMQSSCSYCGVESLTIKSRSTPTDLVLIDGTDAGDDFVRNLTSSAGAYCTAVKNVLRVQNVNLFGPVAGASCRGISVIDNAVYLNRVTGNWANDIEGMIVIEQTGSNIVDTVVISDTEIAQGGGAGAGLKFIGASTTNPPRWVQISNSLFEAKTTGATTGDYALYIDNVKEFKCTNCYFHGGYRAVVIDGGPGPIRFVNSEIGDSRREALYHNADVPTELIGTTVSDGGQETTNTYSGVYLSASSRQFTMIGGRASDDLFFSGSGQKYGIEIISGADEYRFDNVGCEGNDTACAVGLSTAATQAAFTDGTAYADSDWSNYVLVRAPSLSANWTLTLPADDGNSGQFLQTDGSGTTTWATPSGSGNVSNTGTPVDNQLAIWTDATTIEGDAALTFDTTTDTLATTTFSGALSGNATTATALASNPSDCASDTYATTIAASGNLTCASITNASTTGTAVNTPSTLVLRDGSGNFAAGTITAALTGNASTATALAANPADCGADTYATTIAASGALTCSTVTNAGLAGSIAMSKTLLTADAGVALSTNSLTTASAEGSFITGTGTLPGTCSEGAMYQDTDSGGTELYICTASNTWTKTIAATDNVATATALAANPSDCGSDTYATTIAANGNLTCSTVSSAGIANGAIVNDDINASAAIDLSKTALSAGTGIGLSGNTLSLATGEVDGSIVWGSGAGTMAWWFNAGATDPIIDFYGDGSVDVTGTLKVNTVAVLTDGTGTVDATNLATDSVSADELNATGVESELEAVLDLNQLQGQIADGQIADGAVDGGSGGEIADSSVTADDLGADSVSASELNATGVESELEAVLDHNDLQGLTTGDPHTQYLALAGRTLSDPGGGVTTIATQTTSSPLAMTNASGFKWLNWDADLTVPNISLSQIFSVNGSLDRTGTSDSLYQFTGFHMATEFTSSTANGPLFQDAFFDASVVNQVANTGTQNTYQPISFLSKPTFKASSGATLTIGQTTGVDINPSWGVAAGGTLTNTTFSAFKLHSPNEIGGTLSLPTYIALDVEDLDTAAVTTPLSLRSVGTTTEMRHAGPARFGATGAVTSGKKIDVQGDALVGGYLDVGDDIADLTTNTVGVVDIQPTVDISSTGLLAGLLFAPTTSVTGTGNVRAVSATPTLSISGDLVAITGVEFGGTATQSGSPTFGAVAKILNHTTTYTSSSAGVNPAFQVYGMLNAPTVSSSATSGSATVNLNVGLRHNPTISRTGAGTLTITDDTALRVDGTYTESAGTLAVTARTGLDFNDVTNTSSATAITSNIGVDIAALSTGTTNIGIRNADTTVYTPGSAQTLNVVGSSITPSATMIMVTASGATGTLTSNPQVADGVNGQIIHIVYTNGATGSFTFADGNGLRLAGTMLMDDSNTLTLMYSSTIGDWVEIARALN